MKQTTSQAVHDLNENLTGNITTCLVNISTKQNFLLNSSLKFSPGECLHVIDQRHVCDIEWESKIKKQQWHKLELRLPTDNGKIFLLPTLTSVDIFFPPREFRQLSVELLDRCYREDDDITIQLITIQLDNWSKHTSLSLAAAGQHREFLAHPCCQRLLGDLWLGGMATTKYINLRVSWCKYTGWLKKKVIHK